MLNFKTKLAKFLPFNRLLLAEQVKDERHRLLFTQITKALMIVGVGSLVMMVIIFLSRISFDSKGNKTNEVVAEKLKIELANKSIDGDKLWRNKFEEELSKSNARQLEQLDAMQKQMEKKEQQRELDEALTKNQLSEQLKFAMEELAEAKHEAKLSRERFEQLHTLGNVGSANNCEVKSMSFSHGRVKDKRYYIPMSSFVSGKLTTGISVSTSMNSTHDPVDATIQLADIETPSGISLARGNLPKDFAVDLKKCRIEGSAYGDLASERIIIRGEKMICEVGDRYIETDIVAVVRGDDGKNGIKGRVVDTSQKQVNNAIIGAVVSGLSATAKQNDQFTVTGAGLLNTRKMPLQERMGNNVLSGLGSAGEKYADYHLRRAETMSPVLQVDGGVRVDVKFRYGAFLGDEGAEQKVRQLREDTLRNNHVQNHGQGGQASE